MKAEENPDPLGEYKRICPYCKVEFTANHMNRDYCPDKNGRKDYCKNRYKRVAKDELSFADDDIRIVVEKDHENKNIEAIPTKENALRLTIRLMEDTLKNQITIKLPLHHLSNLGASYDAYDHQYTIPGTELKVLTYGPYALA